MAVREDADARHGGLPAVPPRRRDRRNVGGVRRRDRQAGLDPLPRHAADQGSPAGHGFRDLELERKVLELAQRTGIGAQFGGKYFCHDVRIIRLPRHGASCPVAMAVSCSADRQALGKITRDGVFLEQLETRPGAVPPRRHRRAPRRRRGRAHRPQPADGGDPRRAVRTPGADAGDARPGRWSSPATSPTPRSRNASTPASRCRSTSATTACTTPGRPRPRRATRRARSDRRRRDGWTATSTSSRPRAARW